MRAVLVGLGTVGWGMLAQCLHDAWHGEGTSQPALLLHAPCQCGLRIHDVVDWWRMLLWRAPRIYGVGSLGVSRYQAQNVAAYPFRLLIYRGLYLLGNHPCALSDCSYVTVLLRICKVSDTQTAWCSHSSVLRFIQSSWLDVAFAVFCAATQNTHLGLHHCHGMSCASCA